MWQNLAHTEAVLYKSLPWATSDHEKEEKMWCKRWNGFWLIDERSQKKSWFMVNNPIHQNTFPAPASRANNTSMGIQQKGQRLIRVKLRTKAEIFLLASVALMSWNGAPFHVEYVKPGDHRGDPRFISSPITAGDPYSGRGFLNQANKSQKLRFCCIIQSLYHSIFELFSKKQYKFNDLSSEKQSDMAECNTKFFISTEI